jgi:plastocyanin
MIRYAPFSAMLLAVMASPSVAGGPGSAEITIQDHSFTPSALTVPKGTVVTWVNKDESSHEIVGSDDRIQSPELDTGDKFTWTFSEPGKFTYKCPIHPTMLGTVDVTP